MIQHITTLKINTGKPQNILDVLFHLQLQNGLNILLLYQLATHCQQKILAFPPFPVSV